MSCGDGSVTTRRDGTSSAPATGASSKPTPAREPSSSPTSSITPRPDASPWCTAHATHNTTGPTEWDHGSWVAAFLVLVTGVAQVGLGAAQAQLAPLTPSIPFAAVECALWNAGCLAVIVGTLLSNSLTVSIGGGLLVAALGMSTFAVRGTGGQRSLLLLYRALLIVLLVSIPIGTTLAWTRH